MNKESCIKELESGEPSEEAVEYAAEALKKGSKSWKGYRRFKNKYVKTALKLRSYRRDLSELTTEKNEKAIELFDKYFNNIGGKEDGE